MNHITIVYRPNISADQIKLFSLDIFREWGSFASAARPGILWYYWETVMMATAAETGPDGLFFCLHVFSVIIDKEHVYSVAEIKTGWPASKRTLMFLREHTSTSTQYTLPDEHDVLIQL